MYVLGMPLNASKSGSADLSVPIGTPLLTGPGVITSTIILVKDNGVFITVIAALLTLTATWLVLMFATKLYKILGEHWITIISRVMGIIVAAIAVEFISQGVLSIISPLFYYQ